MATFFFSCPVFFVVALCSANYDADTYVSDEDKSSMLRTVPLAFGTPPVSLPCFLNVTDGPSLGVFRLFLLAPCCFLPLSGCLSPIYCPRWLFSDWMLFFLSFWWCCLNFSLNASCCCLWLLLEFCVSFNCCFYSVALELPLRDWDFLVLFENFFLGIPVKYFFCICFCLTRFPCFSFFKFFCPPLSWIHRSFVCQTEFPSEWLISIRVECLIFFPRVIVALCSANYDADKYVSDEDKSSMLRTMPLAFGTPPVSLPCFLDVTDGPSLGVFRLFLLAPCCFLPLSDCLSPIYCPRWLFSDWMLFFLSFWWCCLNFSLNASCCCLWLLLEFCVSFNCCFYSVALELPLRDWDFLVRFENFFLGIPVKYFFCICFCLTRFPCFSFFNFFCPPLSWIHRSFVCQTEFPSEWLISIRVECLIFFPRVIVALCSANYDADKYVSDEDKSSMLRTMPLAFGTPPVSLPCFLDVTDGPSLGVFRLFLLAPCCFLPLSGCLSPIYCPRRLFSDWMLFFLSFWWCCLNFSLNASCCCLWLLLEFCVSFNCCFYSVALELPLRDWDFLVLFENFFLGIPVKYFFCICFCLTRFPCFSFFKFFCPPLSWIHRSFVCHTEFPSEWLISIRVECLIFFPRVIVALCSANYDADTYDSDEDKSSMLRTMPLAFGTPPVSLPCFLDVTDGPSLGVFRLFLLAPCCFLPLSGCLSPIYCPRWLFSDWKLFFLSFWWCCLNFSLNASCCCLWLLLEFCVSFNCCFYSVALELPLRDWDFLVLFENFFLGIPVK